MENIYINFGNKGDSFWKTISKMPLIYARHVKLPLIEFLDKWTSNMEKCLLNSIVLLDLRKAFDLVNTDILLQKREIYNLDNNSLCWFKLYLQGQHQCAQFKRKISKTRLVTHGMPQGSILGLLLFIIFMNNLPLYVNSDLYMFANDSTLHAVAKTLDG